MSDGRAPSSSTSPDSAVLITSIPRDLMMPQMTSMDLYDELVRTLPAQADRVVFVSGGAFTAAARTFLDHVPNQRLEKPFDTQQPLALVNDCTRSH